MIKICKTSARLLVLFWAAMVFLRPLAACEKPNIILITLDDADTELFELSYSDALFPNLMNVARQGVTFRNCHVTTPLCGPSRACLYRGQYAHNTGNRVNDSSIPDSNHFDGGFRFYREQGYFEDDLSVWMQRAGYRTMMVGKFLHADFEAYVPPGWDDFYFYLGGAYYDCLRFSNQDVSTGKSDRLPADLYRTDAEALDSIRLIQAHVARNNGKPFFLNINTLGPHRQQAGQTTMVANRHQNWWPRLEMQYSAAYDELDISDKRGHFALLPPVPDWGHLYSATHYRDRGLAIRSVDDLVGDVLQTVADLGLEQNTYVFITSDNGFLIGHHRALGKGVPVDRATGVPLFVKGPNVAVGENAEHLLAHIDITPTILELAGADIPEFVDGVSFRQLLAAPGSVQPRDWRQSILIENWQAMVQFGTTAFAASTTLRMFDSVYTEWANGDRDFFDLRTDPDQLYNLYDELDEPEQSFLRLSLRALRDPEQPAEARFSYPFERGEIIERNGRLRGLAEHGLGVRSVRLAIRDLTTNQHWNGSQWQAPFVLVDAELENRDGQLTFWNYRFAPDQDQVPAGKIAAWSWAYDQSFSSAPPAAAIFELDARGPELTIVSPSRQQHFAGRAFVYGTSDDVSKIREVRIVIKNLDNDQYWNGVGFQQVTVDNIVRPAKTDQWGMFAMLPSGQYWVAVTAVDAFGNETTQPVTQTFVVD